MRRPPGTGSVKGHSAVKADFLAMPSPTASH